MTRSIGCQKHIVEKLPSLSTGLYYTYIRPFNNHIAMILKFEDQNSFKLWHGRLSHPGQNMMRRIITNSMGHNMPNNNLPLANEFICEACGKDTKVGIESPTFLEWIHGDICGPIYPSSGPFRYFMVLIDASTRWTHVCLLSTRIYAFAKFIAKIIKLRAHFPDYQIKSLRIDNACKFTSKVFDDYFMALGIKVEHPVPYVHTQNGPESLIKRIKLIARLLLRNSNLPTSYWRHAILHAAALTQIWPTADNDCYLYNLCIVKNPTFPIYEFFVVYSLFVYHHQSVPLWALNES